MQKPIIRPQYSYVFRNIPPVFYDYANIFTRRLYPVRYRTPRTFINRANKRAFLVIYKTPCFLPLFAFKHGGRNAILETPQNINLLGVVIEFMLYLVLYYRCRFHELVRSFPDEYSRFRFYRITLMKTTKLQNVRIVSPRKPWGRGRRLYCFVRRKLPLARRQARL